MLSARITHKAGLSIFNQGINSLSNFLTAAIVARLVSPDDFGFYSLLFASLMVLGGLQNALITGPLRILGAQGMEDGEYSLWGLLRCQIILSSLLSVAAFLALYFKNSVPVYLPLTFAVTVFSFQLQEFVRVVLQTRMRMGSLMVADILNHGVRFMLLLVMVWTDRTSLTSVWLVIGLAAVLGSMMLKQWLCEGDAGSSGQARRAFVRNWEFGKWILLEGVAYTISTQAYLYFTALWLDSRSVGLLNAAQNMLNVVNVFLVGGMAYVMPLGRRRLLENGINAWRSLMWRSGIILTGGTVICMAILALGGRRVLQTVYGPAFSNSGSLILILAGAYCLIAANTVLRGVFHTAGFPRVVSAANFVSALVTLLSVNPLFRSYGLDGAALGVLITQAAWITVYVLYLLAGGLSRERIEAQLLTV